MPAARDDRLTIGEVARRSGTTVATLRYYEQRGVIQAGRTAGGHRVFPRHVLRRLAVVAAGQRVGMTLQEVVDALAELPQDRAPDRREWSRLSQRWARLVQARIHALERLADDLDGCIGCGCLSLRRCTLLNPGDEAAAEGTGSRWLRRASSPS